MNTDHLRGLDPRTLMITETIIDDIQERMKDTILTTHEIVSICSSISAYLGNMTYEAITRVSKEENIVIPDKLTFDITFRREMNRQLMEKMDPSVTVMG